MSAKRRARREVFECAHCGADVPVGSKVCRECGSDASTGWQSSDEIDYQSLDLPDGYAASDDHPGGTVSGKPRAWVVITALVLVVVLLVVWGVLRF